MSRIFAITTAQVVVAFSCFALVIGYLGSQPSVVTETNEIFVVLIAMTFALIISIGLGTSLIYHAIRSQRR